MKDSTLDPQERNRRMQAIIRGDFSAAEGGGNRRYPDEEEVARQRAIIEAKLGGASGDGNNRATQPVFRSQQPSERGFDPDAFNLTAWENSRLRDKR